jgi:hypothetical protein
MEYFAGSKKQELFWSISTVSGTQVGQGSKRSLSISKLFRKHPAQPIGEACTFPNSPCQENIISVLQPIRLLQKPL